ncbi:MAG: zinc ribbon domain-containing protein [Limnoraphis robusta]|uniref:Cas12f1-like TNB domain-containing protein n=1 Tax=Limnoraphis robusta CS-951 TaxID=1637645 RepID=A0A0J9EW04_9CYAN|nr:zinc ribbon domain-containing protein [Limnoraphis robusta]KMW70152.1 hypothetical protein WN50_37520 [Limnoraphis robusta CS-951]
MNSDAVHHCLAKSISDAGWTQFRECLEYFAQLFEKQVVAVAPNYTSQDCSNCGRRVKKSLIMFMGELGKRKKRFRRLGFE